MKIVINNRIWKVGDVGVIDAGFQVTEKTEENTIATFESNAPVPTAYFALNKNGKKLLTIYTSGTIVEH